MLFNKNEDNYCLIGGKRVEVRKLSIKEWRLVFGALNKLPGLIVSCIQGKENMTSIVVAAVDVCFDEVVDILAIASGLDKAYIEDKAALDEIVYFMEKMIKKNDLVEVIKKLITAGAQVFPKAPGKASHEA